MATESEKMRLSLALGDEKDCYYVYALCDGEGNPFYIGKGKGARLWAHEEEAQHFVENLVSLDESPDVDSQNAACEERRVLTAKVNEIRRLGDDMKRVVVKWGLTEHEAFMVESSLINLCNYPSKRLTNIQGGHRSKREKLRSLPYSQAWDVDAFLDEVAPPEKSFSDIPEPVFFVNLSESLKNRSLEEWQPDAIMTRARGCWWDKGGASREHRNLARYLLAVYKKRIVGVFEIVKDSWHRMYIADGGHPDEEYARCGRFLQSEIESLRAEGVNIAEIFDRLSPDNQAIFKKHLCGGKEGDCRKETWHGRWYCSCTHVGPSDPMHEFRNAVMDESVFGPRDSIRFYDPRR